MSFQLISIWIIWTGALGLLVAPRIKSPGLRWFAVIIIAVMGWVPVNDLALAAYLRAYIGDLSITSCVLLTAALFETLGFQKFVHVRSKQSLAACVVATACIFYPMALGATYIDPYQWGYQPYYMLPALLSITLASWFSQRHLLSLCISLAVLAYALKLGESDNLWDYLIDPALAIVCAVKLLTLRETTERRLFS